MLGGGSYAPTCYGGATGGYKFSCFSVYDTVAISESGDEACAAKASIGSSLKIYSIGMFNSDFVSGCPWGKDNLDAISACSGTSTLIGTTPGALQAIYDKF